MKAHADFEKRLPLYVAGQLTSLERGEVESHLSTCHECQLELALWKSVSDEIRTRNQKLAAPAGALEHVLKTVYTRRNLLAAFQHTWELLRSQARLIRSEMWPASGVVMFMGIILSLLNEQAAIIHFLAPLVAASTLAILYGPENDPGIEITLSTPTSPWKILLSRLSVVSAYNLLLALTASLVLLLIVPHAMLGTLIMGWLGPMAFLSALALLLSIWLGNTSAIAMTYGLWLLQYIPTKIMAPWMNSFRWDSLLSSYQQFWQSPLLLLPLALVLIGMALWSADHQVLKLNRLPE